MTKKKFDFNVEGMEFRMGSTGKVEAYCRTCLPVWKARNEFHQLHACVAKSVCACSGIHQ